MNLALAADVRIAGESARFDSRFLKIGLHPGGGFTWMARRAMGAQATAAAALFSEVISAAAAERCGLVWQVTSDDELLSVALAYAARAASADPALVRRIKASMLLTGQAGTLGEAVDIEGEAQVWSMDQPAFRDGPVPQQVAGR